MAAVLAETTKAWLRGVPTAFATLMIPGILAGQDTLLRVRVLDSNSEEPVSGVWVSLEAPDRRLHAVTDGAGVATIEASVGDYRLLVRHVGYADASAQITLRGGDRYETITLTPRAIPLPELSVETEQPCPGSDPEAGRELYNAIAAALDQAGRATERLSYLLSIEERMLVWNSRTEHLPAPPRTVSVEEPLSAPASEDLARNGYVRLRPSGGFEYHAPVPRVFASQSFASTHCFDVDGEDRASSAVSFEPLPGRQSPDVSGTVWYDPLTHRPDSIDFHYTELEPLLSRYEVPKIIADAQRRSHSDHPRIRVIGPRIDPDTFRGVLRFSESGEGRLVLSSWALRIPILWGRSRWRANSRSGRGQEVEIEVIPLPFERSGVVTAVDSRSGAG